MSSANIAAILSRGEFNITADRRDFDGKWNALLK